MNLNKQQGPSASALMLLVAGPDRGYLWMLAGDIVRQANTNDVTETLELALHRTIRERRARSSCSSITTITSDIMSA